MVEMLDTFVNSTVVPIIGCAMQVSEPPTCGAAIVIVSSAAVADSFPERS
jgi:uncharacterized radical SAM superfamily protein